MVWLLSKHTSERLFLRSPLPPLVLPLSLLMKVCQNAPTEAIKLPGKPGFGLWSVEHDEIPILAIYKFTSYPSFSISTIGFLHYSPMASSSSDLYFEEKYSHVQRRTHVRFGWRGPPNFFLQKI